MNKLNLSEFVTDAWCVLCFIPFATCISFILDISNVLSEEAIDRKKPK